MIGRIASAGRDAARLLDYSNGITFQARVRELEGVLAETRESISWRITAPLRWPRRLLQMALMPRPTLGR